MNRALTTGTMNTDVMMLPDYSGSASVIEPEKMSPMDSLKAIFEDMRDSLNTLVELAQSQGPSAADIRDEGISDADVVPDPGSDTDSQGNSGFPALEMPKIGPKVGLALMLIGLSALFKYGDEIAAALEPVLKYGKEFYDNLSPTGKIGLGVAGLAALVFPGTLTTLVKTGVGLAFDGLKLGFTTMKDAITSMPGLMKAGYQKGKELLGGAFGLLKEGFGKMRDFVMTTVPNALKGAYEGGKKTVMSGIKLLGGAFQKMRNFITAQMIPGIAAAYGGVKGKLMGVVGKLAKAFTAMRTFMTLTLIPSITAMMAPFTPVILAVTIAVAAAVAIFSSIKAGIDEFKKSLDEGDSMLVAIVEGVTTALLTLVTLPITLIKNFVAWVAEKLGFEGIAEKLREFSIVDFIKDGIKTLVTKAKDFVLGLFNIDFKGILGKGLDILGAIMTRIKAIAAAGFAAVKAAFPGGESPGEAFNRVYQERIATAEASEPDVDESLPAAVPETGAKTLPADINEKAEAQYEMEEQEKVLSKNEKYKIGVEKIMAQDETLTRSEARKLYIEQDKAANIVTTVNNTDASNTNNSTSNTTNTGELAVDGTDSTAKYLAAAYG